MKRAGRKKNTRDGIRRSKVKRSQVGLLEGIKNDSDSRRTAQRSVYCCSAAKLRSTRAVSRERLRVRAVCRELANSGLARCRIGEGDGRKTRSASSGMFARFTVPRLTCSRSICMCFSKRRIDLEKCTERGRFFYSLFEEGEENAGAAETNGSPMTIKRVHEQEEE